MYITVRGLKVKNDMALISDSPFKRHNQIFKSWLKIFSCFTFLTSYCILTNYNVYSNLPPKQGQKVVHKNVS